MSSSDVQSVMHPETTLFSTLQFGATQIVRFSPSSSHQLRHAAHSVLRGASKGMKQRISPKPKPENGRLLFYSSRSGSTWLSELLYGLDRFVGCHDPLLPKNHLPNLWRYRTWPRYYYGPIDPVPVRPVVDALSLDNSATIFGKTNAMTVVEPVVQIANASWAVDELRMATNARVGVLLRDPVAVALSQQESGFVPDFLPYVYEDLISTQFPTTEQRNLIEQIATGDSGLRRRVLLTAVEHDAMLSADPDFIIRYEELSEQDYSSLEAELGLDDLELASIADRAGRPSRTYRAPTTDDLRQSESELQRLRHELEVVRETLGLRTGPPPA